MDQETFGTVHRQISAFAQIIGDLPLGDYIVQLRYADTIMPISDPTAYNALGGNIKDSAKLAEALIPFQKAVQEMKDDKTKWIYRYIRADFEEIDMGPYATEEEAEDFFVRLEGKVPEKKPEKISQFWYRLKLTLVPKPTEVLFFFPYTEGERLTNDILDTLRNSDNPVVAQFGRSASIQWELIGGGGYMRSQESKEGARS